MEEDQLVPDGTWWDGTEKLKFNRVHCTWGARAGSEGVRKMDRWLTEASKAGL